jgi:hypothetical protein
MAILVENRLNILQVNFRKIKQRNLRI